MENKPSATALKLLRKAFAKVATPEQMKNYFEGKKDLNEARRKTEPREKPKEKK